MRIGLYNGMSAGRYAKGVAAAAAWAVGSAALLHLLGFSLSVALWVGTGISVLFTLSFAVVRGLALRRAERHGEGPRPKSAS
jgi:hypothetical protein